MCSRAMRFNVIDGDAPVQPAQTALNGFSPASRFNELEGMRFTTIDVSGH